MVKVDRATPLGVNRVSASLPRWPSKITLLTLRDAILKELYHTRRSRSLARGNRTAGGDKGAGFILGEVGRRRGQRLFEGGAAGSAGSRGDRGEASPCACIGT